MTADEKKCAHEEYLPIIEALQAKHALDIDFIDLKDISGFADAFIIATARSDINARTLRDAADDALNSLGRLCKIEGETSSRWCLIDAGDVVVHIFNRAGREFYKLERLWGDAPSIRFESEE
ncbi:MAG: ribosome silencing factor [Synergistaceae bacterium]|jgi:ribosome-associated protein|nr:ribosome silencing factor [Synergistaceae bacterium]